MVLYHLNPILLSHKLLISFSQTKSRLTEWEWIRQETNCKSTKLGSQQSEMLSYK